MTMNVDLSTVTAVQRAQIIREERDSLVLAWATGRLASNQRVTADWLNERIEALGVPTTTGDGLPYFQATIYGTAVAEHFPAEER